MKSNKDVKETAGVKKSVNSNQPVVQRVPSVQNTNGQRPEEQKPQNLKPKAKKKNGFKKFMLTIFVLLILLGITSGLGYFYIYDLLGEMNHLEIPSGYSDLGIGDRNFIYDSSKVNLDGIILEKYSDRNVSLPFHHENKRGITNIAVFGIDAREGNKGRSDAIIILTIDSWNRKIKLSSVIRDSYVNIEGRGMDKINHAYSLGGPELAIKTLNQNFNLDIRHFITVNFSSMPKVIDSLGGIYLEITDSEAAIISGIDSAGRHLLDGRQALEFTRIRRIDSDLERSRRQRDVIESIISKVLDEPVLEYPQIAKEIFPLIQTNINKNTMIFTGANIIIRNIRTIEQKRFPESEYAKGQTINGVYYYVFDRIAAVNEMGGFIYLDE